MNCESCKHAFKAKSELVQCMNKSSIKYEQIVGEDDVCSLYEEKLCMS